MTEMLSVFLTLTANEWQRWGLNPDILLNIKNCIWLETKRTVYKHCTLVVKCILFFKN